MLKHFEVVIHVETFRGRQVVIHVETFRGRYT